MVWIALLTALTCIGGFIRIPFFPVPLTLQTLFVYLSGSLLGSKSGGFSQILFLLIGLAGVPVFTAGGGLGYVLVPTFGYLVGFPLGAYVLGAWIEKSRQSKGALKLYIAHSMAFLAIFSVGVIYLYFNMHYMLGKEITVLQAFWSGCLIFIPGELAKIAVSVYMTLKLKTWLSLSGV